MANWNLVKYVYIGFGVFVLALAYFYLKLGGEYVDKQAADDWKDFYTTKISGRITYLGSAHHQHEFKIDTRERSFIVDQDLTQEDNGKDDFYFFPKIGDSLTKLTNSDTLFLIRDNKIHWFIFHR